VDPTSIRLAAAASAPAAQITFTADNYYPAGNTAATISWSVLNAASVSIDQGYGAVAASGSFSETRNGVTVTYALTAIGLNGQTYTSSLTVIWGTYTECIWPPSWGWC
jgi:hypothetical protein